MGSMFWFPARVIIFLLYCLVHLDTVYSSLFSKDKEYYERLIHEDLEFYDYHYKQIVTFVLFLIFIWWLFR